MDKGGEDWLLSLRGESYKDAKAALMSLCGVGAKGRNHIDSWGCPTHNEILWGKGLLS